MTEFGIFSDEGLLEAGLYSVTAAEEAIADRYADEEGLEVHAVCAWHVEFAAHACEVCLSA
jgi:hypothetical protein